MIPSNAVFFMVPPCCGVFYYNIPLGSCLVVYVVCYSRVRYRVCGLSYLYVI